MTRTVSHPEEIITQFRQMLPSGSATAQAIDRSEPWERIAPDAVDEGSIEFDDDLQRLIEDYVRRCV